MTSAINYSGIDPTFPIAGQDNDSQGFRDNFGTIQTALEVAKTEITGLQTNVVLKANLTNNATVDNNLAGSTLSNGIYKHLDGVIYNHGNVIQNQADIDLAVAPFHVLNLTVDTTIVFKNWKTSQNSNGTDRFCQVRVHVKSNNISPAIAVSLGTENGGAIRYESGFPALTLATDGKHKVLEAWSYNGGATVFVRYLGEYA